MNRISRLNLITLSGAIAVLLFAGLALAQGGMHSPHGMGRGFGHEAGAAARLEMMKERLDLTAEQAEGIAAIHEQNQEAARDMQKDLKRLENQLEGEYLKDEPSEKAVLDLVEKMGVLRTKIATNRVQSRFAVRELLTPAQRDKMVGMGFGAGRGGGQDCQGKGCGPHRAHRDGRHGGHRGGQSDG